MTHPSSVPPADAGGRRLAWPWYAGAGLLIALDQLSKVIVRSNLYLNESLPLIGSDLLRLTYVQNPGIAFGLRVPASGLLLIFGWIAAAVLAVYLFLLVKKADPLRWPVMLFLAGAIGNSIDRAIYGQVTDFLDMDFPDFIMQRWPVFNVADSCVTIGIACMIILLLFHHRNVSEPTYSPSVLGRSSDSLGSATGADSVPRDDRPGSTAGAD